MLSCGNVGKTYATERGPVDAVHGVDLEVRPASSLAIVGRSGSGKSSLMAMIGGLSRPSAGPCSSRTPTSGRSPMTTSRIQQPPDRLRLPVREPVADAARHRQCRAAGLLGRRADATPRTGARPICSAGWDCRRRPTPTLPSFVRRAATRGHRARAHQRPLAPAGRRADIRPRRGDRSEIMAGP